MRPVVLVVCLWILAASAAEAQQSPLVGTWTRSDPGGPTGPPSVVHITFAPDSRYEWRMMYGRWQGKAAGGAVIQGNYRIVGPTQVSYRETVYMVCPAGTCGPYPPGDPTFGQVKQLQFTINGQQLNLGGIVYSRSN